MEKFSSRWLFVGLIIAILFLVFAFSGNADSLAASESPFCRIFWLNTRSSAFG